MLHKKREKTLRGLYKSASFVVQALCFQQTGCYFTHLQELVQHTMPQEQMILETFLALKKGEAVQFEEMSETLFTWVKKWIK